MALIRACLVFLLFAFTKNCNAKVIAYTAIDGDKLKIFTAQRDGEIPVDHVAKATFQDMINTTGWGFLEIHTSENHNDEGQAYSAGLLEGWLTHDLIWMNYINTMRDICKGKEEACAKIDKFMVKNMQWMNNMIHRQGMVNPYWYQVKLYMEQLDGIADGYNQGNNDSTKALTKEKILSLNLQFDMEDLFVKMGVKRVLGNGRCSALIKILPDYSDIYISQVAWTGYHTMLRIQKKYSLKFKVNEKSQQIISGHTMSFSSYPGQAFSGDDFYVISSGLVTMETTIGNSNDALWNNTQPVGQVMEFIRAMVANRLADSGVSWTTTLKKYNSGTYNNQWMVLDYRKFKPGNRKPKPGLLWVLEQLPGIVKTQDMTDHLLENSYWASYNIAFFPLIFNMSGTPDEVAKYGDWFTYDKHPRALIFKRDHANVKNMDDMLALMRYNDFKHDPLSKCKCNPPYSGENAIAARNDLNLANGTYPFRALSHRNHGATDVKITNYNLSQSYQFLGVSGPTYNESRGIPKFQWDTADFATTVPHLGHPNLWSFKPVTWKWQE